MDSRQQLGKRRRYSSEQESDSEQKQQYGSSDEDDQPRRQRHDSSEEERDSQQPQYPQRPPESNDESLDEEAQLRERAKLEIMQEDQFQHLTHEQIQALINQAEQEDELKLDKVQIKRMINTMKLSLNNNLEKRIQFKEEPEKFLDSEAEVHIAIKQLQAISAYPQHVGDFIMSGGIDALIEVLDHPNPDISIESVIFLTELTDEDLLNQNPEARKTITILNENEFWNFLLRIISRLDDNNDDERKQISSCLKLFENILDEEPQYTSNKLMAVDNFINWLLSFLQNSNPSSENYLQVAETLFTLIQNCHEDYRIKFVLTDMKGLERILGILNIYRKKKLELEEEHEALVNLIDLLCTLLLHQEISDHFRHIQGFELLISLSKKQSELRRHIIKVFDFSLSQYQLNCCKNAQAFIEAGGLPVLFGFFMLKGEENQKNKVKKAKLSEQLFIKLSKEDFQEDDKHTLSAIIALIINTQSTGEGGIVNHERAIFKFIENDFEKLQRLFEIHIKYYAKIQDFDLTKFVEQEEIEYLVEDYQFDVLELIDTILGYLYTSKAAEKLSESSLIRHKMDEFMKFNSITKQSIQNVMDLAIKRHGEDNQNEYVAALVRILESMS